MRLSPYSAHWLSPAPQVKVLSPLICSCLHTGALSSAIQSEKVRASQARSQHSPAAYLRKTAPTPGGRSPKPLPGNTCSRADP